MSEDPPVYENGDRVVESCVFCGEAFEEGQALGAYLKCPTCGREYRIQMREQKPVIRKKSAPEPEADQDGS